MEGRHKYISILVWLLLIAGSFSGMAVLSASSASPPAASISNSVYLDYTLTGWEKATLNSGTTSVSLPLQENSSWTQTSLYTSSDWTMNSAHTEASISVSLPVLYYYNVVGSSFIMNAQLKDVAFKLGVGPSSISELNTIWANLSIDGAQFPWSWSPSYSGSAPEWAIINPQWTLAENNAIGSGLSQRAISDSATITFTATAPSWVNGI